MLEACFTGKGTATRKSSLSPRLTPGTAQRRRLFRRHRIAFGGAQGNESCFDRLDPGRFLFAQKAFIRTQPKPANEGFKRGSLEQQGHHDDAAAEKDDDISAGNGLPSSRLTGMERAAASVMVPRIPDQPATVTACQLGRASDRLT